MNEIEGYRRLIRALKLTQSDLYKIKKLKEEEKNGLAKYSN